MEIDFFTGVLIFLIFSILVTALLKKFTKFETFFLITLIKTKKPVKFFSEMARHKAIIDRLSAIGLILGFGALAFDFVYGRKMKGAKRLLFSGGAFVLLCAFFMLLDLFLGNALSRNSFVSGAYPLLVVSFGFLGFAGFTLFALILQGLDIIAKLLVGTKACPGVAPLIPGVEIPNVPITPPLHAWISLLIILVVHEAMHGIVGRRHGFEIKSTGVILFGIVPVGAFVEPDEKEVGKAEPKKVLPFLAAGPSANLALMVLTGILLFGVVLGSNALTEKLYPGITSNLSNGVVITKIAEQTDLCGAKYPAPANGILFEGDVVKKINGADINSIPALLGALQKDRFDEKAFIISRGGREIEIKLVPNKIGQFGFVAEAIKTHTAQLPGSFWTYAAISGLIIDFLYWLLLLNFLVATVNFLPMNPFDGGRIAKIIFASYIPFGGKTEKEKREFVGKVLQMGIAIVLIVNALPLFI